MAGNIKKVGYATYPSVKLQDLVTDPKTGKTKFTFLKELLFGDFMSPMIEDDHYVTKTVTSGKKTEEYIRVHCRNKDGWIKRSEMQFERPLEINFIDVGQGDGCHIVTPDDKHFLIDAGKSDNMYRFLKWRFNLRSPQNSAPPFTVVISHSDTDHYLGFGTIFAKTKEEKPQIKIKKVYHNGMIEGAGAALGTEIKYNGKTYVTDLCETDADYQERIKNVKAGTYINMLKKTDAPKIGVRRGSEPLYDKNGVTMEIMGPVAEEINGKAALPSFGSNKEDQLRSIMIQKWIALYPNSVEAWAEQRRTGYPDYASHVLTYPAVSASSGVNVGNIIQRIPYPQNEYNTNAGNIPADHSDYNAKNMEKGIFWSLKGEGGTQSATAAPKNF